MRTVNTRFFFVLVGSVIVLAAGLFGVHRLQAGNIASALLWQASQAEKNGKATLAARYLGQYLEFVPDDIDERAHLATVLADVAVTPAARRRAEYVIGQVLAWDPQRHDLRKTLCRLALTDRRLELVEEQLNYLQAKIPNSGDVALLAGQYQELQLQDRSAGLSAKEKSALTEGSLKNYRKAVAADPAKADAYLRLIALLKQLDFGKTEPKNAGEIDQLVSSALLHLPEDAAVLGLAAQRAQEKGDTAAARKYLEAGLRNNAKEPTLYLALARLDNQAGKRSDAIAQLRQGLKAVAKEQQFALTWMLGNLLLDDEQMDGARQIIVQIRGLNQMSADYLDARCMMYQGRWYDAARTLERLRPAFKSVAELALQVDLYLGVCYQKTGDPVLQLARFQSAVNRDPTSLLARHGEALALAALGQRTEALAQFQALIDGNAGRVEVSRWRIEYARMLLEGSATIDAPTAARLRGVLDAAEKDTAQAVECALLRAALLFAEKKVDPAQVELHRIIQVDPSRFEPWVALAELAIEAQQPDQARAILAKAAATVPDTVDFRLARVQFCSRHDKGRAAALDELEANATRFPVKQQARLLEGLADAHHRAGRTPDAVRLLRQFAALPPHAEDIRVRMLLLSLAIGQNDEPEMQRVLAEVKKIEGEPATEWTYGEALRLLWRARRTTQDRKELLEQARGLLNTAAGRRPDWPALFTARGELDELEQKSEQAIGSYRKAIELGSRDPHAVYQLLQLYAQAQRFDEAEQLIRKMDEAGIGTRLGRLAVFEMVLKGQDPKMAVQMSTKLFRPDSKNYRDHLLQGQLLSAGGRISAEAEAAFRKAVALGGTQPETWVALVRYLSGTGQFNKAIEEIARSGKHLDDNVKLLAQAACYEILGALDEAERLYVKAVAQQPTSAHRHRIAADFLLRFGKARDAEPLYRAVLDGKRDAADEDKLAARRGLAQALARGGNPQHVAEALKLVGLALDAAGNLDASSVAAGADERLIQARVLAAFAGHDLRGEAIKLLEAMHQKQPLPLEDQYQLAQLLHLHGQDVATWKKARDLLTNVTTQQPHDARYLALYANLLLLHKDVADAEPLIARLEQLEVERKLPAGMLGATELRARALELRGKELQALTLLQDYAQQKDAPPVRKLLLAGLHGRIGNYEDAVDLCYQVKGQGYREEGYAAAIGLLRANKPPASQQVKLQRWQPQLTRLEESLRESIRLDDGNAMLRLQLADLLELAGRYEQSQMLYRDVLKKDPDNIVALNNLAWLLAQQESPGQEALDLIGRAIARYGPRPELLDTRAVVHLGMGKGKEAVRDMEQAIRAAPTPTRYFRLMRAHHQVRDVPQALAALQRANELGLNVQQLYSADRQAYDVVVPELRKQ